MRPPRKPCLKSQKCQEPCTRWWLGRTRRARLYRGRQKTIQPLSGSRASRRHLLGFTAGLAPFRIGIIKFRDCPPHFLRSLPRIRSAPETGDTSTVRVDIKSPGCDWRALTFSLRRSLVDEITATGYRCRYLQACLMGADFWASRPGELRVSAVFTFDAAITCRSGVLLHVQPPFPLPNF